MQDKKCLPHAARWLALAGLSAAAAAAQAADPASAPNGLMTFPNVRVQTLAESGLKAPRAAAVASPAGMKAYIDPATGQLTQPSAEQAAALDAAGKPAATRDSRAAAAAPRTLYPEQGGVGMALDDSFDSTFIARKTADGHVTTDCLPNAQTARQALKARNHRATKALLEGAAK